MASTTNSPTTTSPIPDPRPALTAAHRWIGTLIAGVPRDGFGAATPCADLDVSSLLAHLIAVNAKVRHCAEGGDPRGLPFEVPLQADPLDQYVTGAEDARAAWAEDDLLAATRTAPFGAVPGHVALGAFVMETVTHGWDLAVATGQPAEADPELVARARAVADRALPAGPRGPELPFDDPVTPPPGAGATEQLAAYLGRRTDQWTSQDGRR